MRNLEFLDERPWEMFLFLNTEETKVYKLRVIRNDIKVYESAWEHITHVPKSSITA